MKKTALNFIAAGILTCAYFAALLGDNPDRAIALAIVGLALVMAARP